MKAYLSCTLNIGGCLLLRIHEALLIKFDNLNFLSCLQVLGEANQRDIVEFCKQEGLVLLADEVNELFFKILDIQLN